MFGIQATYEFFKGLEGNIPLVLYPGRVQHQFVIYYSRSIAGADRLPVLNGRYLPEKTRNSVAPCCGLAVP